MNPVNPVNLWISIHPVNPVESMKSKNKTRRAFEPRRRVLGLRGRVPFCREVAARTAQSPRDAEVARFRADRFRIARVKAARAMGWREVYGAVRLGSTATTPLALSTAVWRIVCVQALGRILAR
jgi:hypothetical protein